MNGPNIKLVVLDECTSALDAIAESEIVMRFRDIARERGQTLIVVTHRLASLSRYADLIL
jgi:ABC-type multidrug transport system fused ATPase/permease subunit